MSLRGVFLIRCDVINEVFWNRFIVPGVYWNYLLSVFQELIFYITLCPCLITFKVISSLSSTKVKYILLIIFQYYVLFLISNILHWIHSRYTLPINMSSLSRYKHYCVWIILFDNFMSLSVIWIIIFVSKIVIQSRITN